VLRARHSLTEKARCDAGNVPFPRCCLRKRQIPENGFQETVQAIVQLL
jgi:hypothetical protein